MEQDDNGSSAKSQSLGHSRQLVDNVPIATRDWNYSKFQYNELLRKIQVTAWVMYLDPDPWVLTLFAEKFSKKTLC